MSKKKKTCYDCYHCRLRSKNTEKKWTTCKKDAHKSIRFPGEEICDLWLSRESSERTSIENYKIAVESYNKFLVDAERFKLIILEDDNSTPSRANRLNQAYLKLNAYQKEVLPGAKELALHYESICERKSLKSRQVASQPPKNS